MIHRMSALFFGVIVFCGFMAAMVDSVPAATCLDNGCHHQLAATKYLHGPVAAEQAGAKGCTMSHQPAGFPCTIGRAGQFNLRKKEMCRLCHDKGTSTLHSAARNNCLECHDPHGSDTTPYMVRNGR